MIDSQLAAWNIGAPMRQLGTCRGHFTPLAPDCAFEAAADWFEEERVVPVAGASSEITGAAAGLLAAVA